MEVEIPVGPRAQLTTQLVRRVADAYGLGQITGAQDLGGAYNLNVRFETKRGPYVARVYRPWVVPRRLAAVQAAKVALQEAGIPVVLPIATPSGAQHITYAERLVEVEPYVDHDAPVASRRSYVRAFAFLGRLHGALAHSVAGPALPPPAVENYTAPAELAGLIDQTRACIHGVPHPLRAVALRTCAQALEVLAPVSDGWRSGGSRLPRQVVHGDFGPGNLLVRRGRVVALVDLEFMAAHERLFDLAYAAFWMMQRMAPGTAYGQRSWCRVRAVLDAYDATAAAPLTDAEQQALPLAMARVPLHWVGEAGFLPDPTGAAAACANDVALAAWIVGHPGEVI